METIFDEEVKTQNIICYEDATVGMDGEFCNVYECPVCQLRSCYLKEIQKCLEVHKQEHHEEEFKVGML